MQRAAIYARYSTDDQKVTSLEDQIRRCKEVATRLGYTVDEEMIFADAAVSGARKSLAKREQYHKLKVVLEEGACEALIADELSRLARDPIELAKLQVFIENSNVRLVTCDGLDSSTPNWQLPFQVTTMFASQFLRDTQHRVKRGMQGQLKRGWMIAAPPIGYRCERELDAAGEGGTKWRIEESEAEIVRNVFAMRLKGNSLNDIAEHLNRVGVPLPRRHVAKRGAFWRPGSIARMLGNTIYRGTFNYRGSAWTQAKAKREKRVPGKAVPYARPALRLVEDDVWFACNRRPAEKQFRAARRHSLSGLASCGVCKAVLTVCGKPRISVYCASCAQAKRVSASDKFIGYTSTGSLQQALIGAINALLSTERVAEYRECLRSLLEGDEKKQVAELGKRVDKAKHDCERLARILREVDQTSEPFIKAQLSEAANEHEELRYKLAMAERGREKQDAAAIERQMQVEPSAFILGLLESEEFSAETQAVLRRLFPRIAFVARPRRFVSAFEIEVVPGVAFAKAAGTGVVIDSAVKMCAVVRRSGTSKTGWDVDIQFI